MFKRVLILSVSSAVLFTAPLASATEYTPQQQAFIDHAKAEGIPGSDDQVFNIGVHACTYIFGKMEPSIARGSLMMSENLTREQADKVLAMVPGELCEYVKRKRGSSY